MRSYAPARIDVLVLVCITLLAFGSSFLVHRTFLGKPLITSTTFLLPCILFLGWRKPKPWKKITAATVAFGLLAGFIFEFIQEYTHSYTVTAHILPKILGVAPVDNILGHCFMALLTFTIYEHFVTQSPSDSVSRRYKWAVALLLTMIFLMLIIYYMHPSILQLPYPYVSLGTLAILPLIAHSIRHPEVLRDYCLMIPLFFFIYFLVEIVAVHFSWWVYSPNNHIGWVSFVGHIRYPFEELFYWMLLYAPALISYYKIFVDRPKKLGGKVS